MKHVSHLATLVIAVAVCAVAADAGQVRFNPALDLEAGATDNVEYVGSTETSDTTLTLAAELPVERSWDGGSLEFRYRPSYIKYSDVDTLDRDEHRLELRVTNTLGKLTTLSAAAGWYKRQEQGGTRFDEAATFEDRDPFLTELSDRESTWANVSLGREQSPRWRWNADIGWAGFDHEAIGELAVDPFDPNDPNRVEDRDEFGGSVEVSRLVSRRTAVGIELAHRDYDLQFSDDEQSELFGVTIDHEANRRLSVSLSLGVARQSFDDPGLDDDTGVQGSFRLSRSFRVVALDLTASHRPDSGGHLAGGSTNTRAAVSLGNVGSRTWNWDAALRFDQRDPTDPVDQTRDAVALAVGAERSFGPTLGMVLGAEWIDQSSDADVDRSAARARVGLRWHPRGRAVEARGDGS